MLKKTEELQGVALDWAVGSALELQNFRIWRDRRRDSKLKSYPTLDAHSSLARGMLPKAYDPSTNWALGGPLVESHGISLTPTVAGWSATIGAMGCNNNVAPLVSAMRVLVYCKVGPEIEVPDELGV